MGRGKEELKNSLTATMSSTSLDDDANTSEEDPDVADDVLECEGKLLDIFCRDDSIECNTRDGVVHHSADEIKNRLPVKGHHAYPCAETYSFIPKSPPEKWPQRPLMMRPSPESGMRIRGVRYSSEKEYVELPGTGYCLGCTLPVNNGTEKPGKCFVIDFETDLFIGTAMMRIKNLVHPFAKTKGKYAPEEREGGKSYFDGKKRTFQAIVRGRFKVPDVPMSECVTGQTFRRAAGPGMPSRWVTKGAISIISRLAPQLQARVDGDRPRFMSPFVSTAQSVVVHRVGEDITNAEDAAQASEKICSSCNAADKEKIRDYFLYGGADETIEDGIHEPNPSDRSSILQDMKNSGGAEAAGVVFPADSTSITRRTKNRKKAFDKLYGHRTKIPTFDMDAEYTFEFFQHLIVFEEFALDFGRPIGRHPLSGMLNGQPLKFMAAHQVGGDGGSEEEMRWLWCFDLWHEGLYAAAMKSEE